MLIKGLNKIDTEIRQGRNVLVHCAAGRNRSPFLVACYIAKKKRIPFSQAAKIVKQRYPKAQIEAELYSIGQQLFSQYWKSARPKISTSIGT